MYYYTIGLNYKGNYSKIDPHGGEKKLNIESYAVHTGSMFLQLGLPQINPFYQNIRKIGTPPFSD